MKHDKTFINSIGMEFVPIPAGRFWMGAADDDDDVWWDEVPRHEVIISRAFHLGKYPVTQAQWQAVMGENPSKFKGPDRPVENVSWDDAQAFIAKLNALEGHERYRLPTEAEWEYACRAGSETKYSFGDDTGELGNYAWYKDNAGGETHPVGQKRPNAWGLYDMHGNVEEWVSDWEWEGQYDEDYYAGPVVDPHGPEVAGDDHMIRGGSWFDSTRDCRSAYRTCGGYPGYRDGDLGFRLALSPEE